MRTFTIKKVGYAVIKTSIFYSFSLWLISCFFAGCGPKDQNAKEQTYVSGYLIENQSPIVSKEDGIDSSNFTVSTNYDVVVEKHDNGNLKRKINFSDGSDLIAN